MHEYKPVLRVARREKPPLRFVLIGLGLLAAGMFVGSTATRPSTAWGEVRSPVPPQHFQSGGQLSLPLLQEISTTLQQIDDRLARMEAIANQVQAKRAAAPKQ